MSARQSPGLEQLFGYHVPDTPDPHARSSRQPTGPPLLDESQSGLLHSFFANPDDVNPSFLSLGDEQAFDGDTSAAAYNAHQYNWLFNGSGPQDANLPHTAHHLPGQFAVAATHPHTRPSSQDYASAGHPSGSMTPSDDVWAAAHMTQGQNGHPAFHMGQYNANRPDALPYSQSQSLDYPASSQHGGPQYNYNHQAISTGMFPASFRPQSLPPANVQEAQRQQFPQTLQAPQPRPALQLKFGSDDLFRSESFRAPSKFQPPDHIFRETVNHNIVFAENNPLGMNPLAPGFEAQEPSPVQKRPRQSTHAHRPRPDDTAHRSDEDARSTNTTAKRRKSQAIKKEQFDSPATRPAPKPPSSKGKDSKGKARQPQTSSPPATASAHSTNPPANARHRTSVSASHNGAAASNSGADDDDDDDPSKPTRENLTEQQKRANHILSEQKRRNLIKQGFEDLNRMVPELRSGGFSKSNMLVEAAKFMRTLNKGNSELKGQLKIRDNG